MLPEEIREKSNEAWLNAVLTNMVDGVITIDMRGTIQTMNPAAVRIFGYDTDEVIGRNISMLAAEPDRSAHDGYISAYLETTKPKIIGFGREVKGLRKGGSTFPMGLAVSEILFGDERYFVGIIRDISERKAAEENLIQAHNNLALQAAELKDANEVLSEYAFAVSHDLKAPLRAIRNYSDFLREDLEETLQEEQQGYFQGLSKAVLEADALIDDLLDYGQVGTAQISFDSVDLEAFISSVIDALNLSDDTVVELAPGWPTIETSPTLLRQIVHNLLSNAIKFNASDVKRVELACRTEPEGMCEISFADNGIGIDPQFFDQVFKIFHRLHTKAEFDGTGIGLAIVTKAVKRLQGDVRVDSKMGIGSTFTIRLPMKRTENKHAG